jgi:peptidyl-prolyl cis-trans isomerase C
VHVVLLGVVLFGVHRWVAPPRASQEIVVPADALAGMREDFRRRTGRMPSATDEKAMLDAYVDDEVLVREGLALGLDRGDIIVRRRLIQKMEFLLENTDPVPPPTDAELETYLQAHADRYASPARVSFTHVFVSSQRAGERAASEADALRAQLDGGADPSALGDPFLRGREFRLHSQGELAGIFGAPFAAAVFALPESVWSAPIRSTFGTHVVRVTEKRPGTAPVLAAVRDRVQHDWREERRETLNREARTRLRSHYVVRVEGAGS